VLRRILPLLGVVTLVAVACGPPDIVVRPQEPQEPAWFSVVVDAEADSGAGLSLATDAEGNPHMSYLAFEEEVAGEAPAPDPLAPTLPAVMHAHVVQGAWTRGPVADEQDLDVASETAIAVDADGVHHVAWSTPEGVLYSSNPEGEFAEEPEVVVDVEVVGLSIAVDGQGSPMIAFQTGGEVVEGPASLIRLATGHEGGGPWNVETVAEASAPEEPPGTAVLLTEIGPMVAFGSDGETLVALQRGGEGAPWVSETVDPDGGVGVSGATDGDGNPHLAYLTAGGDVKHAHAIGAEPWEVSDVGSGATGSAASIAVDADGVHHVAWQTDDGLAYASNPDGEFAEEELPASTAEGVRPRVGAGADGTVVVAFRDEGDTEVQMAVRSEDEPLLAVPTPEDTGGGGGAPTGPPPCEPEGTELAIAADNLAFDTDCLAAPVGEAFTIEFDNQEAVPHNVAIYDSEAAATAFFQGEIVTGPTTTTYEPDPIEDEGNLFFRCDVHPTMSGTFVVAAAGGQGG
jgi:plastocyanin